MLVQNFARNANVGKQTNLILLDFSKALDKVNNSKLIWKLHKRAAVRQNQQNDTCAQQRLRSAWVFAQSDQSLHCPHEDTWGL